MPAKITAKKNRTAVMNGGGSNEVNKKNIVVNDSDPIGSNPIFDSLILTIDSDDEVALEEDDDDEDSVQKQQQQRKQQTLKPAVAAAGSRRSKSNRQGRVEERPAFQLNFDDGRLVQATSTDDATEAEDDDSSSGSDDDEQQQPALEDSVRVMPHSEERMKRAADKLKKRDQRLNQQQHQQQQQQNGAAVDVADEHAHFFEQVVAADGNNNNSNFNNNNNNNNSSGGNGSQQLQFSQLSLSRPLLRAIERAGYVEPTPIQAQVIPFALAGKDICASAETGSGKTAAFVLPFLERLLYRPRDVACIRVLVVTPTRELAAQIHSVLETLAQFTDVTSCLVCGGKKDVRSQEATLRQRPDVIICTPGRMVDHLRNSLSVNLDDLDVLVLDEADRLLELGFQDEVEEILRHCPPATTAARQTMLFSATMTASVEDLVKLSLKRPVRVRTTGAAINFAARLVQEFVKIRSAPDAATAAAQAEIEATLLALICRSFDKKTIVFFEMKRQAHRFYALLQLVTAGAVRAAELHGDMPQQHRYSALQRFRAGEVDVLVATDVAARGIDIAGVQTVINAEMPRNPSIYVHRVGRTARAGCGGRSITLVTDSRRSVMKDVLKGESAAAASALQQQPAERQVLSRTVPAAVVAYYSEQVQRLGPAIAEQLRREKSQLQLDAMEREADKATNLLQHEEEIHSRPARTWYESESKKQQKKEQSRALVAEQRQQAAAAGNVAAAATAAPLTAQQQAVLLAMRDDYPLELGDSSGKHRASRKKRRRQEAMEEIAADREEEERSSKQSRKIPVEALPRRAKVSAREREAQLKDRTLGEIGMKRRPTVREAEPAAAATTAKAGADGVVTAVTTGDQSGGKAKQKLLPRSKVVRQNFAVGGLDQDFLAWGTAAATASGAAAGGSMTRRQLKEAAREKPFTEFDASKTLRKGGKLGSKAFKSKAKYKRRK